MKLGLSSPVVSILALAFTGSMAAWADELDTLLQTGSSEINDGASENTHEFSKAVESLSKRDYEKAAEQFTKLAKWKGYLPPRRREFIHIASRIIRFSDWLKTEKDAFRAEFAKVAETSDDWQKEVSRLALVMQVAEKRKGKLSSQSRKNIQDRQRAAAKSSKEAKDALAKMQRTASGFEAALVQELEDEILRWAKADQSINDLEHSILLATSFLDCVKDSSKIRKLGTDLDTKRELTMKAEEIAKAIEKDVYSSLRTGDHVAAREKFNLSLGKVRSSNQPPYLVKVVEGRLQPLLLSLSAADRAARIRRMPVTRMVERIHALEKAIDEAQASLTRIIHKIEGFADYRGDFLAAGNDKILAATLRERAMTRGFSKIETGNLVRVKSTHEGALAELELISSRSGEMELTDQGRLTNLLARTKAALALLNEIPN